MKFSAKRSLSYYELKQHTSRLGEACSELQRKPTKLQWLYGPVQINGDTNLHNASREAGTHFITRKGGRITEFATNSKKK
jgi:hypothetical protein